MGEGGGDEMGAGVLILLGEWGRGVPVWVR